MKISHRFRLFSLISIIVLASVLVLWGALWLMVGSNIPPKTTMLGVDISRLSVEAAGKKVATARAADIAADIKVTIGSQKRSLKVASAGLSLDIPASISQSSKRTFNPISLISLLVTNKEVQPVIRTNRDAFERAFQSIERSVNVAPRNAGIIYEGINPRLIKAANGKVLSRSASLRKISQEWLRNDEIQLSLKSKKAKISDSQAQSLMDFARKATSAPVTITLMVENPVSITVPPAVIAEALTFVPESKRKLAPKWLKGTFVNAIGKPWSANVVEPINASFIISQGEPRVQPSRDGLDVPEQRLNAAMLSVLGLQGSARTITLTPEPVPAKITTEMAGGLGIKEVMGSFTTYYPYAEYRLTNIHRAARWMDGVIVKPGEVFSYNRAVGERTEARGFVPGIMIDKGVFKKDWGGGVSQVATTTWNAAWFSGLELVQHKPHSFYISRYPPGRESTVAWPNVDVKFRNNSGHPIFVDTSFTNNSVTVTIYGTKFVEVSTETGPRINPVKFKTLENDAEECIFQEGVSGFTIDVWRILKRDGVEFKREKYRTRYQPEDRIICTNPNARWMNPPLSVQKSLTN